MISFSPAMMAFRKFSGHCPAVCPSAFAEPLSKACHLRMRARARYGRTAEAPWPTRQTKWG
eukprot:7812514-Lingulodinium_polyedra.AAC.1